MSINIAVDIDVPAYASDEAAYDDLGAGKLYRLTEEHIVRVTTEPSGLTPVARYLLQTDTSDTGSRGGPDLTATGTPVVLSSDGPAENGTSSQSLNGYGHVNHPVGNFWTVTSSGLPIGGSDRTVCFWYRVPNPPQPTGQTRLLAYGTTGVGNMCSVSYYNHNIYWDGWNNYAAVLAGSVDDGNWHHILCTYQNEPKNGTVWLDGSKIYDGSFSTASKWNTQVGNLGIGYHPNDEGTNSTKEATHYADIQIFDRVLTDEEIAEVVAF